MTGSKRVLGSNLKGVDAHAITAADYEKIPELTDEWFANAVPHKAGKPIARGRPKSPSPKQQVTLRLDSDVVERFRQGGQGWQSRINEALRKAAGV